VRREEPRGCSGSKIGDKAVRGIWVTFCFEGRPQEGKKLLKRIESVKRKIDGARRQGGTQSKVARGWKAVNPTARLKWNKEMRSIKEKKTSKKRRKRFRRNLRMEWQGHRKRC